MFSDHRGTFVQNETFEGILPMTKASPASSHAAPPPRAPPPGQTERLLGPNMFPIRTDLCCNPAVRMDHGEEEEGGGWGGGSSPE